MNKDFDRYWSGLGFQKGDTCYEWAKAGWEAALESVAPEVERSEVIEECARVVESAPGGAALTKHNAYMATVLRGLKVREPQGERS